MNYSGEVTPSQAYTALASDARAMLIDVRTQPEWTFVGVPDLAALGKRVGLVSWQIYPQMQVDPEFVAKVAGLIGSDSKDTPLYFMCRSGQRSRAAAIAAIEAGFRSCYNIAGGFEGDRDGMGHRAQFGGWKFEQLPWVQP